MTLADGSDARWAQSALVRANAESCGVSVEEIANGEFVRQSVIAMAGETLHGQKDAVESRKNVLRLLNGRYVCLDGSLVKTRSKLFRRKSLTGGEIMIGRSEQQPVNIEFKVALASAKELAEIPENGAIAIRGYVAKCGKVLTNAEVISKDRYRQLKNECEEKKVLLSGKTFVPDRPFGSADAQEKMMLREMGACAKAAYPREVLPPGYVPLSRSDWNELVATNCFASNVYSDEGYFVTGHGIRARLMKKGPRFVIAFSGCDLSNGAFEHGMKDLMSCVNSLYKGDADAQFRIALDLCERVVRWAPGQVWIVGHSLGGCLTTYVTLKLPEGEGRIRSATFNGFGLSDRIWQKLPEDAYGIAARRNVNVYCTKDPVYNCNAKTKWLWADTRHFGRAYYLEYDEFAKTNHIDAMAYFHGIDGLVEQMDRRRVAPGL